MAMKSDPSSHQELAINGVARAPLSSSVEMSQTLKAFAANSNKHTPVGRSNTGNEDIQPKIENF